MHDPFHILRAAHVELTVTDLERSRSFYDLLGFVVTQQTPTQLFLRGVEERLHHSLVLTQSDQPAVHHLGFRVEGDEDLENLYAFYDGKGCRPQWRAAGEELGQGRALLVQDPFGFAVEYFAEMENVPSYNQLYHLHRGGAVRRIDHFNCFVPQFDAAFEFWTNDLGFRLSEYVESDDEPREKSAVWMHKKPSVHDLALMKGTGPRVHHIGFWMEDMMSIIHVCDILGGAALHEHIERGPGRHGISNAFFLYLRDPDGHRIELYTSDYLTLDPDMAPIRWSSTDPRRQTLWGHQTPDSWWREASPMVNLSGGGLQTQHSVETAANLHEFIK